MLGKKITRLVDPLNRSIAWKITAKAYYTKNNSHSLTSWRITAPLIRQFQRHMASIQMPYSGASHVKMGHSPKIGGGLDTFSLNLNFCIQFSLKHYIELNIGVSPVAWRPANFRWLFFIFCRWLIACTIVRKNCLYNLVGIYRFYNDPIFFYSY